MTTEIWKFDIGVYKVYTENKKLKEKFEDLKDCKLSCHYDSKTTRAWDFIFPSKILAKIKQIIKEMEESQDLT